MSSGNGELGTPNALHVARTSALVWQQGLADKLEAAIRPHVAGVFLCPLGNVLDASAAMAPGRYAALGQRLIDEILPGWLREGMLDPYRPFAPEDSCERMRAIRQEFLRPAGLQDLTVEYLRTEDGEIAGWISVFSPWSRELDRSQIEAPLREVWQSAQEAVRVSLAIAVALGARLPQLSPVGLSERERQIAELAASGLSDLNIACHLTISEGTVGRHLHNIFGKLGVRSRRQLGALSMSRRRASG
jgi:DNA-binding CsgD family transcriptional regulator